MGQMKDIAVQYVDYLVASGQISTSQYMDTLKGILDGEIGISKAWLISEIYDGDIVAMEAECGTMVRKKAELYSSEFVEWNYTAEGPNCFICGDLWRPGDYEGHDNICITCAEVWDYDEGGPEGEGYYRTNAETEECQWFDCKNYAVCLLDDMQSCKACAVAYLTRYEAESFAVEENCLYQFNEPGDEDTAPLVDEYFPFCRKPTCSFCEDKPWEYRWNNGEKVLCCCSEPTREADFCPEGGYNKSGDECKFECGHEDCEAEMKAKYEAESDGSLPKMTKTALDKERGDIEGMGHHRWLVGEGYSGRAKCKVCGEIIPKGQPTIDFHSTGGIMSIHSRPEHCAVKRAESFAASDYPTLEGPTRECPNCGVVMGEEYQAVDCCGTTVCDDCVAWVFSVEGGRWDDLVIDGIPPSADEKKSWENLRSDGDIFCHKCLEKIIPNAYDQGYDTWFEAEIKDYHNKGRFMDIVVDDDGTYGGVLEVWNPETMMPYEDDSFNVDTFEANYNPNQSRDSKGRWTSQKISSDVLPQGSITTPTDDEEEYNEHLLNVYEELYEDKPEIPQLELGEYQDIAPLTEVFDEGADAETLMMFLSSAANDEDFPDRYVGDEEFQEAVHQMVALLNEEMFIDVNEMFDDLDSIASLTGNPDMKGFVRRAQIVTNLLTDIKQQQTEWAAEELGKDSCCCGATSKNPCLCMIEGIMNCSSTEPMCPCYEIKKYEAEDTKTFEGRSHFPPGKHDVTDAEAALKYKHPAVTKVNSYEYLIFQEGTSNKFHVFFDTNAGYFNVYGSIGYPGRVVGPMTYNKYYDKMRKKIKKGYQKKAV